MKITVNGMDGMESWYLFGRQAVSNSFYILGFKEKLLIKPHSIVLY